MSNSTPRSQTAARRRKPTATAPTAFSISVIVRTKNRPHLLQRCLQSLAEQQRLPEEVVVVNDGGAAVEAVLQSFSHLNIQLLHNPTSQGRALAGNQGVNAASGSVIAFLDDDDRYLPDHLLRLAAVMQQFDAKVAYSGCLLLKRDMLGDSETLRETPDGQFNDAYDPQRLRYENYIPLINLLIERALWLECGGFDPAFDLFEDWDLLQRLAQRSSFYHLDKITAEYGVWGSSQITREADRSRWENAYRQILAKHVLPLPESEQLALLTRYWVISQERRGNLQQDQRSIQQLQTDLFQARARIDSLSQVREHELLPLQKHAQHLEGKLAESQAAAQKHAQHLESKLADLENRLAQQQNAYATLDAAHQQQHQACNALQQAHADLQAAYRDSHAYGTQLEARLTEVSGQIADSLAKVDLLVQSPAYALARTQSGIVYEDYQRLLAWITQQAQRLADWEATPPGNADTLRPAYRVLQQEISELRARLCASRWPQVRRHVGALDTIAQGLHGLLERIAQLSYRPGSLTAHLGLQALLHAPLVQEPPPRPLSAWFPTYMSVAGSDAQPQFMENVSELGDTPLFLDDPTVALCFTVQCSLDGFYRLDLLLATCRRVNPCQLRLLVRAVAQGQVGPVLRQVWFSGLTVCDNQFHAIQFEPLEESAGKTYQIELDSPDATPDTGIAAWCHTRQPQVLGLQRLSEAEPLQNPGLLPLWAQQGLSALPLSAQLQAWRPNQAQATAPRYCLLIHGIDLDTSPLHLHLFLSRFGQLLAAQGLIASFCLAGVANSALRDYVQGQQWTLEPDTALPALLRLGLSSGAAWLWSCQVRALPADDLLSRAEALFADPELAVLVPMETAPGDTIRAAYAQVVRDGGLKNLAAGQPVEHPWFGYRRKVEATHSSLLMLRSSALQNLDWAAIAAYATPAYQLTDLIWQCKMQQYTTVYQGALRWQHSLPAVWAYTEQDAADGLRFNQRWRAQLPTDLPPLARVRDLLNPDQRPSVLVIDATLPTFDEDSGSLRLYTLLKIWAALGYHLSFIPDNKDSQPRYRRALEDLGIEVFHNGYNVQHALSQRRYDYAFICRVDVGHRYMPLIRLLSPETWIFYDTVDIHYVRELRQAEIENKPDIARRAQLTKRKELHNCRLADEVITVTDDDGRHLQQELPYLHYQVLPNIHRQMPPPAPYAERDGLVFIGNYNHPPNEDAVLYFVAAVLPKIRQRLPDLRLYLVGSHMKERLKALASDAIEVVGWIDEVEPFFAQRRVFVSYLRYGAGMKGKLGQAMAAGLPVVSTTMGAEGMGMVDGETALIADDPDSFAEAVCRLYSDAALWEKLVTQGQAYIEQTYGETAARQKLMGLLESWPRPAPPV